MYLHKWSWFFNTKRDYTRVWLFRHGAWEYMLLWYDIMKIMLKQSDIMGWQKQLNIDVWIIFRTRINVLNILFWDCWRPLLEIKLRTVCTWFQVLMDRLLCIQKFLWILRVERQLSLPCRKDSTYWSRHIKLLLLLLIYCDVGIETLYIMLESSQLV